MNTIRTLKVLVLFAAGVMSAAAPQGLPQGIDPGWWGQVQGDIQREEYALSWQEQPGAWQAPNRAQGFRTTFTEDGIRVVPRTGEGSTWEWGLALVPLPVASSQ